MQRRKFLKISSAALMGSALPFQLMAAPSSSYNGPLLIQVYAHGGWDPTCFFDPKDSLTHSNWSKNNIIQKAGNIKYAPFADNARFFDTHYDKTLIINGINHRTAGHGGAGTFHTSGVKNGGYPTLSTLFALTHGAELPMALLKNDSYAATNDLIPYTGIGQVEDLIGVLDTNVHSSGTGATFLQNEDFTSVEQYMAAKASRRNVFGNLLQKQVHELNGAILSTTPNDGIKRFSQVLANLYDDRFIDSKNAVALNVIAAMSAGVSSTAATKISNFDTHQNHDEQHAVKLTELTTHLDLLWELAEKAGIDDRLTITVFSDVGRTPYNATGGKDHHSVSGTMVMKKNVNWTNRVAGLSSDDDRYWSTPINAQTLQSDSNGIELSPGHVMYELREMLGINQSVWAQKFPINIDQRVNIFNV